MRMRSLKSRCFFLACFSGISLFAANWKVFAYMDASDGLCDIAIKNITDMMLGVHLCVAPTCVRHDVFAKVKLL